LPSLTTDAVAALGGPEWLTERRQSGLAAFERLGLPSVQEEVWRYSPIGDLDLDRFSQVQGGQAVTSGLLAPLQTIAGVVVDVIGGAFSSPLEVKSGVSVGSVTDHPEGSVLLGSIAGDNDALISLNDGLLKDALIIDVEKAVVLDAPIVIVHHTTSGATFPRTVVRLGDGAIVTVLEVVVGGDAETLNVPVTELCVGDGANLRYGSLQFLDRSAWHLSTIGARVGRDGTVAQFTAGLGGGYDRCRSDVELAGQGAASILRSTYLGGGDQIHDLRTKQDHVAPKTQSDLLCKGAVSGTARSIYSGLIKIQKGAMRSDARQTNHNLVLSESAHADSVPNLDISENDVRCSHASTVGPINEDQRYYLESRGISPAETEQLLVRGFFKDLLDKTSLPVATQVVGDAIEQRLAEEGKA